MDPDFDWSKLKQFSVPQTVLAFFIPSGIAFIGFRFVLPILVDLGYPKLLMWGVIAFAMLLIIVIIGLNLIKNEAETTGISIGKRLLLKKIGIRKWLICLVIMIIGIALSAIVAPSVKFFEGLPGLSIPEYMPFWLNPSINPLETDKEVLSPGFPLEGNYMFLVFMGVVLLVNILAEEIYFRAWLLPKMQSLGKWSWVVNGSLFALYHTFQLWLFPMLFIISLATALTIHTSKSILPAFVTHFVANFLIGILGIIMVVLG